MWLLCLTIECCLNSPSLRPAAFQDRHTNRKWDVTFRSLPLTSNLQQSRAGKKTYSKDPTSDSMGPFPGLRCVVLWHFLESISHYLCCSKSKGIRMCLFIYFVSLSLCSWQFTRPCPTAFCSPSPSPPIPELLKDHQHRSQGQTLPPSSRWTISAGPTHTTWLLLHNQQLQGANITLAEYTILRNKRSQTGTI